MGAKANLVIPPEMGYGDEQRLGGKIPAGATLHFDIEVVAINDGPQEPNIFQEIDANSDGKINMSEAEAYFKKFGGDNEFPSDFGRERTLIKTAKLVGTN